MRLKKTIFFLISIALTVGVLSLSGDKGTFAAGGTEIADDDISVDFDKESVIIDETAYPADKRDSVIYFTESYVSDVSKWSECEIRNNKATFDISWVKDNQDVKIYLCGDVNTRVTSVVIKWKETLDVEFTGTLLATDITDAEDWKTEYARTEYKEHFGEDTGYFIFTKKVNNREQTYIDLDSIEWRKGSYGNWQEFSELDLHEMEIRGVTLEFRIKSVSQDEDPNGIGARYSSIARLSVSKINVGPSVRITMNDGTINLKNGQEYSLDKINWYLIPVYSTSGTTSEKTVSSVTREDAISPITTSTRVIKMTVQEALGLKNSDEITTEQTIYVRTAGAERAAASKITEVVVPETYTLSDSELNDVIVSYVSSKSGNGGIQVTNNTDYDMQVAVLSPANAKKYGISTLPDAGDAVDEDDYDDLPVTQLSWTTLKANNYTKIAYSRAVTGSMILIRKAGKTDNLPSPYRCYEKTLDYSTALTYASISGTAKLGYTFTANPSTNVLSKLNSDPDDFIFKWEYADSKNASVWTEIEGVGSVRKLNISDSVPDGSTDPSVYSQVRQKFVRVTITYNGVSVTSTAVGYVN